MHPDRVTSKSQFAGLPTDPPVTAPTPETDPGTTPPDDPEATPPAHPEAAAPAPGGDAKPPAGLLTQEQVNAIVAKEIGKLERKQADATAAAVQAERDRLLKALGVEDEQLSDTQLAEQQLTGVVSRLDEMQARLDRAEEMRAMAELHLEAVTHGVGEDRVEDAVSLYVAYVNAVPEDREEDILGLADWLKTKPYLIVAPDPGKPAIKVLPQPGGDGKPRGSEALKVLESVLGGGKEGTRPARYDPLAPMKKT